MSIHSDSERGSDMDPILVAFLVAGGALVVGLLGAIIGAAVARRHASTPASRTEAAQAIRSGEAREAAKNPAPPARPEAAQRASEATFEAHEELLRDALETLAERVARLERLASAAHPPPVTLSQHTPAPIAPLPSCSLTAHAIAIPPTAGATRPSGAPRPGSTIPSTIPATMIETLPPDHRVETISASRAEIQRIVLSSAARGQDAVAIAQLLDLDVGEVELILRLHRGM
jgi:hypothetical protein